MMVGQISFYSRFLYMSTGSSVFGFLEKRKHHLFSASTEILLVNSCPCCTKHSSFCDSFTATLHHGLSTCTLSLSIDPSTLNCEVGFSCSRKFDFHAYSFTRSRFCCLFPLSYAGVLPIRLQK